MRREETGVEGERDEKINEGKEIEWGGAKDKREGGLKTQTLVASIHMGHSFDSSPLCEFHLPQARTKCRASVWCLCPSLFHRLHPAGCRHRRSYVRGEQIFVRMRTFLAA